MKPTAINDSCCGFCQLRSQLDPFSCIHTWTSRNGFLLEWQDSTIQITTSSSLCKKPDTKPKASHLRPSAQHTLTVLGHGRPCSQKHFTWGHPENCGKASDLHLSLFVSLQKKTISFYCIICHMILLFCCSTLFLPFQQTIAYVVITPWPWCPTCNFNMSQLQSLKKSHHFFQLQRLVRSKCISLIFKPWQPCCFGTEIQYIHSPSMTTFATTLSFKSEKLNPKLCHS